MLTSGKKEKFQIFFVHFIILTCGILNRSNVALSDDSPELSHMNALRMQLFTNYDKNVQPTYKGEPTNISIALTVNYIDIDENSGKMVVHAWVSLEWYDENRTWDKAEYGNISLIHLRPRDLWKPEIVAFNSVDDGRNYLGDTQALLYNTGKVLWVPPVVYTTYCSLNLYQWPYDSQTCKLKLGSWRLTTIDPVKVKANVSFDYQEHSQTTEWMIANIKSEYVQKDYYNYIEYTFKLTRRSSMYGAVIFTPAFCIKLLALSTFWLPPQMGEKILLNSIVIIVIAAFLMYFAQLLPILAENTPLIVLFYSSSLLLLSFSTIVAVIVLYLSTAKHKQRVPEMLKNLLNGTLGKILLLSHFTLEAEPQSLLNNGTRELGEHVYDTPDNEVPDPMSNQNQSSSSPSRRSIQFDWILLATAIDRISFVLYCLIFVILAFVYAV